MFKFPNSFKPEKYLTFLIIFCFIFLVIVFFAIKSNLVKPTISILVLDNEIHVVKNPTRVSFGFLPYWAVNDFVEDYSYITDLAYFSLYLNSDGTFYTKNKEGSIDPSYNNWKNNKKVKQVLKNAKKNNIRTHLTISLHENDEIENFLNCRTCWETSYKLIEQEVLISEVNGINFDFEYAGSIPVGLDSLYTDYLEYISKNIKTIHSEGFLITVSTYAVSAQKPRLMNISQLGNSEYIDYLFIMAYDFYTRNSDTSGPLAPLNGKQEYGYDLTQMTYDYLSQSSSKKLILGLPIYGYNWIVESVNPGANRISGNDTIGYSVSQFYWHIMDYIEKNKTPVLWDELSGSPYYNYVSDTGVLRQVFFENTKSLKLKMDLAKNNDFAGVGLWALAYDKDRKEIKELFRDYLVN